MKSELWVKIFSRSTAKPWGRCLSFAKHYYTEELIGPVERQVLEEVRDMVRRGV